ncbi:MAG: hypothetical protein P0S95_03600 [Rhabdochlamydiaceae bacterium]|nr:hypothetical protein [Candidatus Amphrikana amoebophyrae]
MRKIGYLLLLSSVSLFSEDYKIEIIGVPNIDLFDTSVRHTIVITGDPNIIVCAASAGDEPSEVIGTPCQYSIEIDASNSSKKKKKTEAKITAQLQNTSLPKKSKLYAQLNIDKGNGKSKGYQSLETNKASTVVQNITKSASGLELLYKFSPSVQTQTSFPVEVLYTLSEE